MICPACGTDTFRVKDTRIHYETEGFHCIVIRIRECFACGHRQKTPETVESSGCPEKSENHPNTICSIDHVDAAGV
jgi:transcriptional regulator NrdR family protein